MHVLDRAALGGDAGTAELGVEVFDVQGEDVRGTGGRLVQHPPERAFSQGVPMVGGFDLFGEEAAGSRAQGGEDMFVGIECGEDADATAR